MAKGAKPQSTQHASVLLDLEYSGFQDDYSELSDTEQDELLATLEKIQKMTWDDVQKTSSKTSGQKRGINWEPLDQWTATKKRIASIRVSAKFRARVCRDGRYMRFISLHPDHDSAYKARGGEKI